ncbi:MAG TPA: hypothetical protein VGJ81_15980 [Thermoanaerobaculia bacterium]|jgi:hypothetical protein
MEAWLITWDEAGHDNIDRFLTVLPNDYEPELVRAIAESIFYVGAFTPAETIQHRLGSGLKPQVFVSRHANDYVRINICFSSAAISVRRVRNLLVSETRERETFSWEEQNHDGTWDRRSYERFRTGVITFEHE